MDQQTEARAATYPCCDYQRSSGSHRDICANCGVGPEIHAPVEAHNAYGWIKPTADACSLCGRKSFATPVDGFQVRECTRCSMLICEQHSDTDCDSDQDGYFTTEWVCNSDRAECEAITMLNELADTVAYPFAVAVLVNAAEHLSERRS